MSDSRTSPPNTLKPIRQELYDIIRTDLAFEQKAERALELGVRGLDVDEGYVTRVDPETAHWEAVVSTASEGGHFPTGLELDFGTSYCRRTVEADSSVALHDAPRQGWDDDPAFETHGMHCYHGTTLELDGDVYGTVCFVAEDPRERFDDAKTMFAELIAQELERELERKHRGSQLTRQINLVNVLNRVLRHNLRNDLSVVRGRARLMMEQVEDGTHGEACLQNIDELIELAQKARDLDRVVAEDLDRQKTDVVALVERVIDDLAPEYPDASFTVEHEGEVIAAVQPSFERAVEELVENAAKHGGDVPTVGITIERVPNAVEVKLPTTAPGLTIWNVRSSKVGLRHR